MGGESGRILKAESPVLPPGSSGCQGCDLGGSLGRLRPLPGRLRGGWGRWRSVWLLWSHLDPSILWWLEHSQRGGVGTLGGVLPSEPGKRGRGEC